ncbi:MAG: SDR family NAD(P)-dependent oxidoreductase, partial [Pseudomonadales bacterium]
SGIGQACAVALAACGHRVALCARRGGELDKTVACIEAAGGEAFAFPADLTDVSATAALVKETIARFQRLDLLLNNAGYSGAHAIEQMTRADIRRLFDVNLLAGLQLISEAIPEMRRQGSGRIINISSAAGWVPAPLAVPYAASKAAMNAATDCLRLELKGTNIRLSIVAPGFVDTAVFDNARNSVTDLRADPNNPYREAMFKLDAFAQKGLENALAPSQVADLVVKVATAERPRAVYFMPRSIGIAAKFFALVPKAWAYNLLLRTYRL